MFEAKTQLLEDENRRLREALATEQLRVAELTKAVIALSDRAAFRVLYPQEKRAEVVKSNIPLGFDPRREIYQPKLSAMEVADIMAKREEEGRL
jgi:hypothetical protein